ncbi:MAG: hypothetical protein WCV67_21010 [Victivallaceae bacterium]
MKILSKYESSCAERLSKASESDGCPSGYAGRMGETVSVQRHSKVSESDGCPSGYAGRMGETVSVQRHSKVSESGEARKAKSIMFNDSPKCRSGLSQMEGYALS